MGIIKSNSGLLPLNYLRGTGSRGGRNKKILFAGFGCSRVAFLGDQMNPERVCGSYTLAGIGVHRVHDPNARVRLVSKVGRGQRAREAAKNQRMTVLVEKQKASTVKINPSLLSTVSIRQAHGLLQQSSRVRLREDAEDVEDVS